MYFKRQRNQYASLSILSLLHREKLHRFIQYDLKLHKNQENMSSEILRKLPSAIHSSVLKKIDFKI